MSAGQIPTRQVAGLTDAIITTGDARYVRTVNGVAPDGAGNVAVSASSSEVLMQDGVTGPPVPIETEARDDWLYSG